MIRKKAQKNDWRLKTPLRKPPRLDGKAMNRGIKSIRKKPKSK